MEEKEGEFYIDEEEERRRQEEAEAYDGLTNAWEIAGF